MARILGGDCTWLSGGGGITFDVKGILKDEEAEGRLRTEEVDVALSSKTPPTRGEVESCFDGSGSICEGGSKIEANGLAGMMGTVGKVGTLSSSALGDNAERIFPMVLDIISSSSESEESNPLASMIGLGEWKGDSKVGLGEL